MSSVELTLESITPDIVLVGINFPDETSKMTSPGFDGTEKAVSVTRGGTAHTLTIHFTDGKSPFSFSAGSSTTLVSSNTEKLRDTILEFISNNLISLKGKNVPGDRMVLKVIGANGYSSIHVDGDHLGMFNDVSKTTPLNDIVQKLEDVYAVKVVSSSQAGGGNDTIVTTLEVERNS